MPIRILYLLVSICLVCIVNASPAHGQRAFFENITIDNHGFNGPVDLSFHPSGDFRKAYRFFARADGSSLDLDGPDQFCIARFFRDAETESFAISGIGIGIGTDAPQNPGLHILSDGAPYTNARLHIENIEPTVSSREQLRLTNHGPPRFAMENSDLGVTWSFVTTADDQFQIRKNGPGTAAMAIRPNGSFSFSFASVNNLLIKPNGNANLRGTLSQGSDRNAKKNIQPVDPIRVLERVVELPISHWTYKKEPDHIRHLGPMSQDFYRSFELGSDDKSLSTLDTSGVALAAIQGLKLEIEKRDQTIQKLVQQVSELSRRLDRIDGQQTSEKD